LAGSPLSVLSFEYSWLLSKKANDGCCIFHQLCGGKSRSLMNLVFMEDRCKHNPLELPLIILKIESKFQDLPSQQRV
jgi:hypothetical protein